MKLVSNEGRRIGREINFPLFLIARNAYYSLHRSPCTHHSASDRRADNFLNQLGISQLGYLLDSWKFGIYLRLNSTFLFASRLGFLPGVAESYERFQPFKHPSSVHGHTLVASLDARSGPAFTETVPARRELAHKAYLAAGRPSNVYGRGGPRAQA
jgi:hypothetical protein